MSKISDTKCEFTITWIIENYSLCCQKSGEHFDSPVFCAESLEKNSRWLLSIYSKGFDPGDRFVHFILARQDEAIVKEIKIDFKIEINPGDGHLLYSKEYRNRTFKKDGFWMASKLVEDAKLMDTNAYSADDTLTFRCHLVGEELRKSPTYECVARTKIGVERLTFTWNIKNFHSSDWLEKKHISFPETSQFEIILTAPEENVEINIHRLGSGNSVACTLSCKISVLNAEGTTCHSRRATHGFEFSAQNWRFPSFFKKTLFKAEKNEYSADGTFTLYFEFSVPNGTVSTEKEYIQCDALVSADSSLEMDPFNILRNDFQRMFTNHLQCDVRLRAGGETFPAHKSILSARSPVFCAMFEQDMLENQTGIVNIPDVDAKTLNSFLGFIYAGTMDDLDYDSASKLLIVADKYQVLSLQDKCSSFLTSAMTDENVCKILQLADMVSQKLLKASAVSYIKKNIAKILLSEHWQQCIENNAKLASEILSKLSFDIGSQTGSIFSK